MLLSLAAAVAAQAVVAQSQSTQPTSTAPIAAPVTANAILRVGTEVPLRLSEELTTKGKQLRVGQRFHLETAEPVLVQGVNVIPVGSPAVGSSADGITLARMGRAHSLSVGEAAAFDQPSRRRGA